MQPYMETHIAKIGIREWQPGDGLTCTHTSRAGRIPCGPPVAVLIATDKRDPWRGQRIGGRRVVCALHLPDMVAPGTIAVEAEKAARERLAVAHWDEYQQLIDDETSQRLEDAYEFANERLKGLALGTAETEASAS